MRGLWLGPGPAMLPPFVRQAFVAALRSPFRLWFSSGPKRFGTVLNIPIVSGPDHRNFVAQHLFQGLEMKNVMLAGQR